MESVESPLACQHASPPRLWTEVLHWELSATPNYKVPSRRVTIHCTLILDHNVWQWVDPFIQADVHDTLSPILGLSETPAEKLRHGLLEALGRCKKTGRTKRKSRFLPPPASCVSWCGYRHIGVKNVASTAD